MLFYEKRQRARWEEGMPVARYFLSPVLFLQSYISCLYLVLAGAALF